MDDNLKEQLQKQALEATLKVIEGKISTLVCPEHGQSPKLKFSEGAGPGKQNIGFECCCDAMGKKVQEILKT